MKIGIVSDTHGDWATWQQITQDFFQDVDLILHAGDVLYHGPRNPLPPGYNPKELAQAINNYPVPILIARGNCDTEVDQMVLKIPIASPYLFTVLEGWRVLIIHGHQHRKEELCQLAQQWKVHLCITGHTHIPKLESHNGTIFFNPGSCSLPKGEGIPTLGIWEKDRLQLWDIKNKHKLEEIKLSRG